MHTQDHSSLKVLKTPPAFCKQATDSLPANQIAASLNLSTPELKVSQNQSQRGRDRVTSLWHREWLIQPQVLWRFIPIFFFCFSCLFISGSSPLTAADAADATWRCGGRLFIWFNSPPGIKTISPQISESSAEQVAAYKTYWDTL